MSTRCSAFTRDSVPTSSVPRPRWLCVASGTSSRMRSTSPSANPASSSRSLAAPRTSPCAQGQALMPEASTPTTRRTRSGDAAAIPISVAISWVGSPVTGVAALERVLRLDAHLGAQRVLALDDVRRDVLGQRLDEERLADHDLVDRLPEDLGEPRHVDALLGRIEVDGARDLGRERLLVALVPDADRLLDAGHPGPRQAQPYLGQRCLQIDGQFVPRFRHRVEP